MFVDSGGFASAYETGIRMGGAFELKQATWALGRAGAAIANDPVLSAALDAEPVDEWFRHLPWQRGHSPLRHVPEYEDYLFDQWEHEDFGPFWQQPCLDGRGHVDAFPDVPSLHLCSWYDPYVRTAVENFTELGRRGTRPVQLVLGPWTHGRRSDSFAGEVDFGHEAPLEGNLAPDYADMRADWFDAQLSGTGSQEPAVRYFVMGGGSGLRNEDGRVEHGGHWRTAQTWPPESARAVRFHLHPGGLLHPAPSDGLGVVSWDHHRTRSPHDRWAGDVRRTGHGRWSLRPAPDGANLHDPTLPAPARLSARRPRLPERTP